VTAAGGRTWQINRCCALLPGQVPRTRCYTPYDRYPAWYCVSSNCMPPSCTLKALSTTASSTRAMRHVTKADTPNRMTRAQADTRSTFRAADVASTMSTLVLATVKETAAMTHQTSRKATNRSSTSGGRANRVQYSAQLNAQRAGQDGFPTAAAATFPVERAGRRSSEAQRTFEVPQDDGGENEDAQQRPHNAEAAEADRANGADFSSRLILRRAVQGRRE
jgi:hypothetical protein